MSRFASLLIIVVLISVFSACVQNKTKHTSSSNTTQRSEFNSALAVSGEEQMVKKPSPGEYIAFSLKVAQKMIAEIGTKKNYRVIYPNVYNLGGINHIHGLVYDRELEDMILVGKYDPVRQPLTLDDLVVALKARFIHEKWPLVSIDPTENTKKTGLQNVRFDGGIRNTQFGADLLDADYKLKRIAFGLLPSGIQNMQTSFDLSLEWSKKNTDKIRQVETRYWFYPMLPNVSIRENVVAIKGLKVGVFSEVEAAELNGTKVNDLTNLDYDTGKIFAKEFSRRYDELALKHPSLSRMQGLNELVALSKAIEEMDEKPNLTFWIRDYRVKRVIIPKTLKVLSRQEKYTYLKGTTTYQATWTLSGGVELMAIALRLNAGDVTALRDAVIKTRPQAEQLSWSFIVGEWIIPTAPEMLKMNDVSALFSQAIFLSHHKRYEEAIGLYGKVIKLKPDLAEALLNRGNTHRKKMDYNNAIKDYNRAMDINPRYANAYNSRGVTYANKGDYDRALEDYNHALEINPMFGEAYSNRGNTYSKKGEFDNATKDYNRALEINPRFAGAYNNRGAMYANKGDYDRALEDYNHALEINPRYANAYNSRGVTYENKGDYDRALEDYNHALEINPRYANAYSNRGNTYRKKGDYDSAFKDYNLALEINPRYANAYSNRGGAYDEKGDYDSAIKDYNRALEINPRYSEAYYNRGNTYRKKGDYDSSFKDYNRALEINPRFADAHSNLGIFYLNIKKNIKKSCYHFEQACQYGICGSYNLAKQKGLC